MPKINTQFKQSLIPQKAITKISLPNNMPLLAFKHVCKNHCLLEKWTSRELSDLVKTIKTIEELMWQDIPKHKGLDYKGKVPYIAFKLPDNFPPDADLAEFKVNKRCRLLGYRAGDVFNIIWFDREHAVCPEGKQRKV